MAFHREEALARAATWVCTIEDGKVRLCEAGRTLQRHRATNMQVCSVNFVRAEAKGCQHVEINLIHCARIKAQRLDTERIAKRIFVKGEPDVESGRK